MGEGEGRSARVQMVTVDENNDGQRLDNFLLGQLKGTVHGTCSIG